MINYDVCVIGGGPAGMAAALKASESGKKVAILERDTKLGGILNQCIHNGFGLHYFGEELTGTEYADRFVKKIEATNIDVFLGCMVLNIDENKTICAISPQIGYATFSAKAVVLAMGCRERNAGAIRIAGSRPKGVFTAGQAQKFCNIDGYLVGKKIVILGSGDIGLIMARRLTYEGAKVLKVIELMPYSSGLKRNIVQCLDDNNIPLLLSHTITKIVGKTCLQGVYYAPVVKGVPDLSKEQFLECDTLLLSVGLIPENDLVKNIGIDFSSVTSGATVDEFRQTTKAGFFACGNVLHVHDLVDNVSNEGAIAGENAVKYIDNLLDIKGKIDVQVDGKVRYALPQFVCASKGLVDIYFRVANVYKNVTLKAMSNGVEIFKKKYLILSPGEMEVIKIDKAKLQNDLKIVLEE
ncbi:MAG: FAD-dependent oxidoreductase [Clostridia bacterium]